MDSEAPEYRALSTDVILHRILINLDTHTLCQCCRLVSRKFHTEATSILRRKRTLRLKNFNWTKAAFDELHSLAVNSKRFPFNGLILSKAEGRHKVFQNLEAPTAARFFQTFGSEFIHLRLEGFTVRQCDFVKLFLFYLPNISTLELGGFHLWDYNGGAPETQLGSTLPTIRRITFQPSTRRDREAPMNRSTDMECLLWAATNLETIDGDLRPSFRGAMMGISAANCWNKVTSLKMIFDHDDWYHGRMLYASLTSSPPPSLTHLTLDWATGWECGNPDEFRDCFCAILSASQSTLKSLAIGECPLTVEHISGVTFGSLEILELVAQYPTVDQLARQFPVLKEIRFKLRTRNLMVPRVGEGFGATTSTPPTIANSVPKLVIFYKGDILNKVKNYVVNALPRVRDLVVEFLPPNNYVTRNDRIGVRHFWSFVKEFRSLERIEVRGLSLGSHWIYFDEFFTGMTRETINMLEGRPKLEICEPYDEILRPFLGVCQLQGTGVRELVLWIPQDKGWSERPQGDPLISIASVWYGLYCVPDLNVTVKTSDPPDLERTEELRRFVRVEHAGKWQALNKFL